MNNIPSKLIEFIQQNHVVSLACSHQEEIWAASCFYVFDSKHDRLIVLTKQSTQHGKMMLANPHIAGTIAAQPDNIQNIEGIQFTAIAQRLTDSKAEQARLLYTARHPIAKLIPSDVWEIRFTRIKHTENRLAFAQKTEWQAT
ncbi:pyridoxamine 5'-phosphate oxidase family protein [Frederiksenia canicola]|uniref:Pyridoxamine 5'-phosphate oxidase putative domain-containing protein n=1 Tax=Frederiksenia canicola TaxID=123824 RepID=A0AAE6X6Z4_9PAST|nr:pyridoxamine 5'-phosphate oxidase family protein [Frederiksenia canicola]QIM65457.1 hypothetical protein A4G17_08385 [Frederiksenia canicola]RPE96099.1 hypothetical protein EDC49_0482 [Frederiksenia canicola]